MELFDDKSAMSAADRSDFFPLKRDLGEYSRKQVFVCLWQHGALRYTFEKVSKMHGISETAIRGWWDEFPVSMIEAARSAPTEYHRLAWRVFDAREYFTEWLKYPNGPSPRTLEDALSKLKEYRHELAKLTLRDLFEFEYPQDCGEIVGAFSTLLHEIREQSAWHRSKFEFVCWFGFKYNFNPTEATTISFLWEKWEDGEPEVYDEVLVRYCNSKTGKKYERLSDIFGSGSKGRNPAWNSMIVKVKKKPAHYLFPEPTIR